MTWVPVTATAAGGPLTGPCGPRSSPAASAPPWKATRAGSSACVRSPWPEGGCWPARGMTGRCGSGTPRPASSAPRWKATMAPYGRCARSPWPGRSGGTARASRGPPGRAGRGGTVRIWDPQPGQERTLLEGHQGGVWAVCPVTVAGKQLLASAGSDGTVRIWDPQTGQQRALLEGHHGSVWTVCPVTVAGKQLLASTGSDGTVRIWDPETGQQRTVLEGHRADVGGVCPVTVAGRELLASAGDDGTVRVWDPQTGTCHLTVPTYYPGEAIAWVAGSLAIGLGAGILVIKPRAAV